MIDAPVLAFPNFDQEFILETDASGVGLGAILAQKQPDGTVRPIAYGSRTLQQHKKKYGATELEALGVAWAVKHFCHYLYGRHYHVFTDYKPLKSLLNTPHSSGKLAHWGLALQEVDIVIHYRTDKSNVSADSLSHYPVAQSSKYDVCAEKSPVAAIISKEGIDKEGESSSSLSPRPSKVEKLSCSKEVRNKGTEECCVAAVSPELGDEAKDKERKSMEDRQREDTELKLIIDYQKEGVLSRDDKKASELLLSRAQYHMEGGVLYYVEADKTLRLIPPTGYRKHLFEEAHCGKFGAHLGGTKVHGQLSKHYWWPRMRADISGWSQGCLVCATRQPGKAVKPPLTPIPSGGSFSPCGNQCNSVCEISFW